MADKLTTSQLLLEAYRNKFDLKNDHQVALHAKIADDTVRRVLRDGYTVDDYTAARLAQVLGWDTEKTVWRVKADRAKSAVERRTWLKLAGGKVASFAPIGALLTVVASQAHLVSGLTHCILW